jgi:hypothetical protein
MGRERFLEVLAAVSVGLALLAGYNFLSDNWSRGPSSSDGDLHPEERAAAPAQPAAPESPVPPTPVRQPVVAAVFGTSTSFAALAATSTLPVAPIVPAPPAAPATPAADAPIQAPGTYAEFDSEEDRQDSLAEMQRQKLVGGIDALNARARRKAEQARSGR